nr:vomeronasal type-1 receptor 5-like [Macaca fascicularis]
MGEFYAFITWPSSTVTLLTVVPLLSPGLSELLYFQNDFKCKGFFFYLNKVMRSFSICTTCLLSVLQAIIISPRSSRFNHKYISFSPAISSFHIFSGFFSVVISSCAPWRLPLYFHSTSLSPRPSPEKSATQTILLLVSFFVVIYWVDFIISCTLTLLWAYDPVVLGVQRLVGNVYCHCQSFGATQI